MLVGVEFEADWMVCGALALDACDLEVCWLATKAIGRMPVEGVDAVAVDAGTTTDG